MSNDPTKITRPFSRFRRELSGLCRKLESDKISGCLITSKGIIRGELIKHSGAAITGSTLPAQGHEKPHYTLDELLADHDGDAPVDEEWDKMPPAGREIW